MNLEECIVQYFVGEKVVTTSFLMFGVEYYPFVQQEYSYNLNWNLISLCVIPYYDIGYGIFRFLGYEGVVNIA